MKGKPQKGKPSAGEATPGAPADELPERWSVQRKTELVLRLVRGEALDAVSRETRCRRTSSSAGSGSSWSRRSASPPHSPQLL